jgi:hypothetical protein
MNPLKTLMTAAVALGALFTNPGPVRPHLSRFKHADLRRKRKAQRQARKHNR